jgi:hypothetical protein
MPMLREHKIFRVTVSHMTKDRVEDGIDEYHYTDAYRTQSTHTIIAPNELVAKAWGMNRHQLDKPEITGCESESFDAFIQEHVW